MCLFWVPSSGYVLAISSIALPLPLRGFCRVYHAWDPMSHVLAQLSIIGSAPTSCLQGILLSLLFPVAMLGREVVVLNRRLLVELPRGTYCPGPSRRW
jgi:hypothetical protein